MTMRRLFENFLNKGVSFKSRTSNGSTMYVIYLFFTFFRQNSINY